MTIRLRRLRAEISSKVKCFIRRGGRRMWMSGGNGLLCLGMGRVGFSVWLGFGMVCCFTRFGVRCTYLLWL